MCAHLERAAAASSCQLFLGACDASLRCTQKENNWCTQASYLVAYPHCSLPCTSQAGPSSRPLQLHAARPADGAPWGRSLQASELLLHTDADFLEVTRVHPAVQHPL